MKTKEITICGGQVVLAYCFATELSFKNFTGENIEDFTATNPEHVIYLILSAIASYYQSKEKEDEKKAPIVDSDLMYNATPNELVAAANVVLELRAEWYGIPKGDNVEEKPADGEAPKNA